MSRCRINNHTSHDDDGIYYTYVVWPTNICEGYIFPAGEGLFWCIQILILFPCMLVFMLWGSFIDISRSSFVLSRHDPGMFRAWPRLVLGWSCLSLHLFHSMKVDIYRSRVIFLRLQVTLPTWINFWILHYLKDNLHKLILFKKNQKSLWKQNREKF